MTYTSFIYLHNNHYIDYDQSFGYQCTDLMRQYVKDVVGVAPYTGIPTRGNAKDIFKNFVSNRYFTKILNTKINVPQKGDIIFWGTYPTVTGFAGHVAIFDHGDLYTVVSFDQNYPTGSPCHFVKHGSNKILHGYRGVLGWLRPNKEITI